MIANKITLQATGFFGIFRANPCVAFNSYYAGSLEFGSMPLKHVAILRLLILHRAKQIILLHCVHRRMQQLRFGRETGTHILLFFLHGVFYLKLCFEMP